MNTTENNKLIAEFMGIKYVYDDKYIENIKEMRANGFMFEYGYMLSELKYHTDWNWLMEVVDKIASIKGFNDVEKDLNNLKINANIEDVYKACVSFIKYYNQQENV